MEEKDNQELMRVTKMEETREAAQIATRDWKQSYQENLQTILESKQPEGLPEGIKNNDAYMLMDYKCNSCQAIERIWNGRNAVSPFGVACNICGGTMNHINWHLDMRIQNYIPAKGQRYFVDFTRERAEEVAGEYMKRYQKTEYAFPPEEVEDALYEKIHDLMNGECSMDLITMKEE